MAGAGTLAVNLIARTGQFKQDIRGASGVVRGFSSGVTSIGRKMSRVFGVGGLLSGGGMLIALKMQADALDNIAKKSKLLGLTTEEFTELGFHARKSGVEMRAFEMGVQRAIRKVGELARGVGEGAKALKDMGFAAGDFAGLSGGASIELIMERISRESNQAIRVAMAQKIFDSEGVALLNLGGAAEVGAGRADARRLGESVTLEQALAGVAAKDAMEDFTTSMNVAVRDIAIKALPGFTVALATLTELISSTVLELPDVIGKLGDGIQSIGNHFDNFKVGLAQINLWLERFISHGPMPTDVKGATVALNEAIARRDANLVADTFTEKIAGMQAGLKANIRDQKALDDAALNDGAKSLTGNKRFGSAAIVGSAGFAAALLGTATDEQLVEMRKQNALLAQIEANLHPAARRIPPQGLAVFV